MNKEESLALYAQGKDAWNAWANDMLAEKKRLEESGEWGDKEKREGWEDRASADFSGHEFPNHADFSRFIFPYNACFMYATFSDGAWFLGATFSDSAWYDEATFVGEMWFFNATFVGDAVFRGATFSGEAVFNDATFRGGVWFRAIESKSGFDLTGAEFAVVPSFIQAHFVEAPSLDGVVIPEDAPPLPKKAVIARIPQSGIIGRSSESEALDSPIVSADAETRGMTEPSNLTARYRALKRMAIQAHDHANEQNFFAAELKSMRGTEHNPPFGANWGWWLAGHIYEILSDFGRSPRRVLEWMFGQWFVFAQAFGLAAKDPLGCTLGEGNLVYSALSLSAGNTLFPFMSHSDKAKEYLFCLFGGQHEGGQGRWVPAMTDWYAFLSTTQSLFSLLLIFLLLLSIRAHFRVK